MKHQFQECFKWNFPSSPSFSERNAARKNAYTRSRPTGFSLAGNALFTLTTPASNAVLHFFFQSAR